MKIIRMPEIPSNSSMYTELPMYVFKSKASKISKTIINHDKTRRIKRTKNENQKSMKFMGVEQFTMKSHTPNIRGTRNI